MERKLLPNSQNRSRSSKILLQVILPGRFYTTRKGFTRNFVWQKLYFSLEKAGVKISSMRFLPKYRACSARLITLRRQITEHATFQLLDQIGRTVTCQFHFRECTPCPAQQPQGQLQGVMYVALLQSLPPPCRNAFIVFKLLLEPRFTK